MPALPAASTEVLDLLNAHFDSLREWDAQLPAYASTPLRPPAPRS